MIRNTIRWSAAIVLSVAAFQVFADDKPIERAGEKLQDAADRTKENLKDAKAHWDSGRVFTMLTQVTESAVTKDGFDNMVSRFNDADRNRIRPWYRDDANKDKLNALNAKIDQFRAAWKEKYNQEFDITKDEVVWGGGDFGTFAKGEMGKDAELAGMKLPPVDNSKIAGGDKNLEKGRNVGVVTVNRGHDMPELKVFVIHELPDMWKIDVPDEIDGGKLCDNLMRHLTMALEMKDKWPADVNDGYRAIGHHVLAAVEGVDEKGAAKTGDTRRSSTDAEGAGEAQTAGSKIGPDQADRPTRTPKEGEPGEPGAKPEEPKQD